MANGSPFLHPHVYAWICELCAFAFCEVLVDHTDYSDTGPHSCAGKGGGMHNLGGGGGQSLYTPTPAVPLDMSFKGWAVPHALSLNMSLWPENRASGNGDGTSSFSRINACKLGHDNVEGGNVLEKASCTIVSGATQESSWSALSWTSVQEKPEQGLSGGWKTCWTKGVKKTSCGCTCVKMEPFVLLALFSILQSFSRENWTFSL